MEQGTVKWFDGSKGYGFILRDSGGEIFVHSSQLTGVGALLERERVEFDILEDDKGKQAKVWKGQGDSPHKGSGQLKDEVHRSLENLHACMGLQQMHKVQEMLALLPWLCNRMEGKACLEPPGLQGLHGVRWGLPDKGHKQG